MRIKSNNRYLSAIKCIELHYGTLIFLLRVFGVKRVLFIGGDKRSLYAMEELKNRGFSVSSYGISRDGFEEISDFDVIVLPVPTTRDKRTVFCPLSNKEILLSYVGEKAENRLIISCGYSFEGKNNIDVLSLDGYAFRNAVPTAEGAIAFAIDNTDFTLWKSKVLVIGNGRVAKVLIQRLKSFGCDLTVSARNDKDFSLLETEGIKYTDTYSVAENLNYDIIFNTVDALIFSNPDSLKGKLLIDLSSKGCIDFDAAKEKQIAAYKLPGLPGKVAPKTAGKILAETVVLAIKMQ